MMPMIVHYCKNEKIIQEGFDNPSWIHEPKSCLRPMVQRLALL
ncbi:hypothetical protein Dehly_0282 [Dehalogenimonas lykanthroporepellens BL-DC-9]|nr:hypothetical protein Dehly_0282 [Dehalogenimonas lykanthroporepellens BL-DC-9]